MKRAAPPWLPNWREPKNYPTTLTLAEWRWQFLRRRPDYQRDFASLVDVGHMEFLIRRTKKIVTAISKTASEALTAKYGVLVLLDPASDHAPLGYFPSAPVINVHADHVSIDRWQVMGYSLCRIDLAAPLDHQLRGLKILLAREAKTRGIAPAGKREAKHWQRYLRVLDAYAVGEKPETIINQLHDLTAKNKTAKTWHTAAKKQQAILTGRSS